MSPLNSTPEIKKEVDGFLSKWLPLHSMHEKKILYHYTTLEGLKGILQNRSLWFSHISTLNDPLELQYGRNLISDELTEFIENEKDIKILSFLKSISSFIKGFGEVIYHVYVASFCEDENLLSQWRSYTLNGGGYNLGISIDTNTKFCHNFDNLQNGSYIILRKVIYDYEEQKNIIKNYLIKIIEGAKNAIARWEERERKVPITWESQAAIESVNILFDIMFSLKNKVFSEEREWRLIKVNAEDANTEYIRFRERKEGLIPYLNTYIFKESDGACWFPIESIKYGPAFEGSSTRTSLSLFLRGVANNTNSISIDNGKVIINGAGYILRDNK